MFYINLICVSAIDLPFSPRLSLSSPPEGGGANLGGLIFPTGGLSRSPTRSAGCRGVHQPTSPCHPRRITEPHIRAHLWRAVWAYSL